MPSTVFIPLRDGCRLATDIYLPEGGAGRFPVLLMMTPYGRKGLSRLAEPFKVKAADGITDLYGVMYKPFDFDPNKKYPIIDYVYPGPQTEGNNLVWSKGLTRVDRLAQIGFIVITVGNRGGHPNRSKWYHNYGYGNLRDYGLELSLIHI